MFSSLTADFGLSKIIDDQVTMKTVCGTPGYCGESPWELERRDGVMAV